MTSEKTEIATCSKDKTPLRSYEGSFGYEAIFCPKCGRFEDSRDVKDKDTFFIHHSGKPVYKRVRA